MSGEQCTNQGGLVPSGSHGLTPRSAGLVRWGLDSLLAGEGRPGELWNMYTDAGEEA
jgi:hypothetical protein